MKNLTKLIGSIGLAGVLSLGGCGEEEKKSPYEETSKKSPYEETSKEFPYDEITFTYYLNKDKTNKVIVEGAKKGDLCTRGKIIYEDFDEDGLYDKFQSYIDAGSNKVKSQLIKVLNKDRDRFDYQVSYLNRSLKNCEMKGIEEKIIDLQDKHEHDLSLELRPVVVGLMKLGFCNDDWKWFLKEEFEKSLIQDTISIFQLSFYDFSFSKKKDKFSPRIIRGYAKNKSNKSLCGLSHEDTDRDYIFDNLILVTSKDSSGKVIYNKEEIKYKSGKFYYFGNSKSQKRPRELMNAKMSCEGNPLVQFLHEKYYQEREKK